MARADRTLVEDLFSDGHIQVCEQSVGGGVVCGSTQRSQGVKAASACCVEAAVLTSISHSGVVQSRRGNSVSAVASRVTSSSLL